MTDTSSESRSDASQRTLDVHRLIEELYPRIEQARRVLSRHDAGRSQLAAAAWAESRGTTRPNGLLAGDQGSDIEARRPRSLRALGDGHNAMALARVLLANACLLEWLLRGEGRRRLEPYVLFRSVPHERGAATINRQLAQLGKAGGTEDVASAAYHRAVWTHVPRCEGQTDEERPADLGL